MPRTAIPIQTIPRNSKLEDISFTDADSVNDHEFDNSSGDVILLVDNTSGGALVATVVSIADPFGRTGDLTVTTAATSKSIVGPLQSILFNQSGALVNVDTAAAATLKFAAVRFTPPE